MYDLGGIDNVDGGASGFPGGFNFGSTGMNIDPNEIFNMFFSENMNHDADPSSSFFNGFKQSNNKKKKSR